MSGLHALGGSGDSAPVLPTTDVLPHSPSGSFLHRDAFLRRTVTQRRLLLIRQSQGHCHATDGIRLIPSVDWWSPGLHLPAVLGALPQPWRRGERSPVRHGRHRGETSTYNGPRASPRGRRSRPIVRTPGRWTSRPTHVSVRFVSEGGLEPPRPCGHQPLKLARLPIPPLRRGPPGLPEGEVKVHVTARIHPLPGDVGGTSASQRCTHAPNLEKGTASAGIGQPDLGPVDRAVDGVGEALHRRCHDHLGAELGDRDEDRGRQRLLLS